MMKKYFTIALMMSLGILLFGQASAVDCSPTGQRLDIQQAVKWYRHSAEKKAMYRQAYLMGEDYVRQWVRQHHPAQKTWGVILDVDETALDNSWYFEQCRALAEDENSFEHYVSIPQHSIAVPGVIKFTHFVHQLGGYVSFVSNRDGSYQDNTGNTLTATVNNLKQQGIYFDQVVLGNYHDSQQPTDKNSRFQAIISGNYIDKQMVWSNKLPAHQVIAYFGDNIQDFPNSKQTKMKGLNADDQAFSSFGKGYFIFPNPMYGSWVRN